MSKTWTTWTGPSKSELDQKDALLGPVTVRSIYNYGAILH